MCFAVETSAPSPPATEGGVLCSTGSCSGGTISDFGFSVISHRLEADDEPVPYDSEPERAERNRHDPELLAPGARRHGAEHHAGLEDDERALEPVALLLVQALVRLDGLRLRLRLGQLL